MKHIRNFRNFSINELQDWTMMPVDVNRGMGDMLNKFYTEFADLLSELKNYIGNKFSEFKNSLTQILTQFQNMSADEKTALTGDLVNFVGNSDKSGFKTKIENLVRQELSILTESRYFENDTESYNKAIQQLEPEQTKSILTRVLSKIIPSKKVIAFVSYLIGFISPFVTAALIVPYFDMAKKGDTNSIILSILVLTIGIIVGSICFIVGINITGIPDVGGKALYNTIRRR